MIALVDVNSFYASCEQVFRPDLWGKPVVVLSNNDGCIIAANAQAKALGIPMWRPLFENRDLLQKHRVAVFSSNYALYGDMSRRVMETLSTLTPALEVYSIDEAFCEIPSVVGCMDRYGGKIVRRVQQWTGLPVCVGIGETKTLAKLANRMAKAGEGTSEQVCVIDTPEARKRCLQTFGVDRVWGIGRQHASRLRSHGITTAWEVTQVPDDWMRRQFTVVGLRLKRELEGKPQLPIKTEPDPKKMIGTAKSFGHNLEDAALIREALAWYVSEVAEKLRAQKRLAGKITVFLETNRFRKNVPQYNCERSCDLLTPTDNTSELVQAAYGLLDQIHRPGFAYKKVGVWLSGLVEPYARQLDLFTWSARQDSGELMKVMDTVNHRYGKATLRVASAGYRRQEWKLRQEHCSPRFTTRLSELIKVGRPEKRS